LQNLGSTPDTVTRRCVLRKDRWSSPTKDM